MTSPYRLADMLRKRWYLETSPLVRQMTCRFSTALARDMVTKYGMSEKMGPVALEGEGGKAMFGPRRE